MTGFNWVDLILIFMLLVGMAVGYAEGLVRQLVGLAAVYIGLVIATQFFVPLSQFFAALMLKPPDTLTNAISFFAILLLVMSLINLLGFDALRRVNLTRFPFLNHLSGMLVGVASMWVLMTVTVNVLTFAINTQSWGSADEYRLILENGITHSRIAEITSSTLPMIVATIRPWLPMGLPAIFEL